MEDRVNVIEIKEHPTRKKKSWLKGLLIFLGILALIVGISVLVKHAYGDNGKTGQYIADGEEIDMDEPYIGQLSVEGEIYTSSGGGILSESTGYHHAWTLKRVEEMMNDNNNRGIFLCVETPGGSTFATEELYQALKKYKKKTGRPLYVYMGSQAASGGYYISMASDKILANKDCWTGSIGVTLGDLYDITDLLEKYGIKVTHITSGPNKAMGSMTAKLTKEQKEILQSLVDESFDEFVKVVVEGRHMSEKKVRELADGRIYSASQALDNGLIDQIAAKEEAAAVMKSETRLDDTKIVPICYEEDSSLFDSLLMTATILERSREDSDLAMLRQLMENSGKIQVLYMAPIRK